MKKKFLIPISVVLLLIVILAVGRKNPTEDMGISKQIFPNILNKQNESNNSAQTKGNNAPIENIPLAITYPKDKSTVASSAITIKGQTTPNAEIAVNEIDTKADSSGNFSAAVSLDEGENTIIVVANDQNGNYSEKEVTVTFGAVQ